MKVPGEVPRSAIVGVVEMVDCVRNEHRLSIPCRPDIGVGSTIACPPPGANTPGGWPADAPAAHRAIIRRAPPITPLLMSAHRVDLVGGGGILSGIRAADTGPSKKNELG